MAILQYVDGPAILELEANFFVDARATTELQSHQWQGTGEERWLGSGFYCERPAG
jgi:hypothetical protein